MTEPVKLSRERWEMLRSSWEFPHVGLSNAGPFINVREPRQVGDVIFLPASYMPDYPSTCLTIPMVRA